MLSVSASYITTIDVTNNILLKELFLHSTNITTLDVSSNTLLDDLDFSHNSISIINLANNPLLKIVKCRGGQLTSLDFSNNNQLEYVSCSDNLITSIVNINNKPNLITFLAWDNLLTTLDFSNDTSLGIVSCYNNQLNNINVNTNNPNLEALVCDNNNLNTIDVSNISSFRFLDCEDNQLTSVDLRGTDVYQIAGPNNSFQSLNNPNLFCVDVDDVNFGYTNWLNSVDSWTGFSTNCVSAFGCTDESACNYDPIASIDDSSCYYVSFSGQIMQNSTDLIVVLSDTTISVSYLWNTGEFTPTITPQINGLYWVLVDDSSVCQLDTIFFNVTNLSTFITDLDSRRTLLKITNILGQESPFRKKIPLFYIYDDGTVEKRIKIE